MEPLTAGAIAIGTVIATKAVEKTGECDSLISESRYPVRT